MKLYARRDKRTGEFLEDKYHQPIIYQSVPKVPKRREDVWELVTFREEPTEYCKGCIHDGKYERAVKEDLPSPCTRCRRRVSDNYTPKYEEVTDETVCD